MYQLKNVKTFMGREGEGFNATLYFNGKKIAHVDDYANGGPVSMNFTNKADEDAFMTYCRANSEFDIEPEGCIIDDLFNKFQEDKFFKRNCKKKTIVLLKSGEKGSHIEFKHVFDAGMKKHIQKQYGDDLKEIVNERYQ